MHHSASHSLPVALFFCVMCAAIADVTADEPHELLDWLVPLPIRAMSWVNGWEGQRPMPDFFSKLHNARIDALHSLFQQQTANVDRQGAHMNADTDALKLYAKMLVTLCSDMTPSGCRITPLEFEWTFQAEQVIDVAIPMQRPIFIRVRCHRIH